MPSEPNTSRGSRLRWFRYWLGSGFGVRSAWRLSRERRLVLDRAKIKGARRG